MFTESTSDHVLDTWFQYTSDDTPIRRLLASDMSPDMSPDDLLRVTLQIADQFIALYADIVAAADTEEIRTVFQNLRDEEQTEKEKVARNFQMFMDL